MSSLLQSARVVRHQHSVQTQSSLPPIIADYDLEEASPYGLQGLSRGKITLIKPDCVNQLAIMLALYGSRKQISDPDFVAEILKQNPGWVDEYHIVHLIEKSLWIQGRSNLVMTMIKNPSFIPDNPPDVVTKTLLEAYFKHSHATIWYGVPLFGEEKTASGLPIPLTAEEVKSEAERRIKVAQQHALRWGWFYQAMSVGSAIPPLILNEFVKTGNSISNKYTGIINWVARIRKNYRCRKRQELLNQLRYTRYGKECYVDPYQNISDTDKFVMQSLDNTHFAANLTAKITGSLLIKTAPITATGWGIYSLYITLYIPLTIIPLDPFLFIELKDEPGRLRHLAHWYWQEHENGKRTLHLHT